MSNRLGMDTGLVRSYADQMDGLAEALGSVVASVNNSVGQLSTAWLGADAQELEQRWHYHDREAVALLATHVRELARTARTNAAEQDRASGVSTSGSGVSPARGSGGDNASVGVLGAAGLSMVLGQALRDVRNVRNGIGIDKSSQVGARASFDRSGSSKLGAIPVSGSVNGNAWVAANAKSSARLSPSGADASVAVSAGAGVGIAASGMVGNRYVNGTGAVGAEAMAQASGSAAVHAGRDGVSAKAHGDAFVGGDAYAKASADVGGVGGTAGVHGYAGAGVHVDANASVTLKEVKASVTLGAALGLGAGVTVSADVHPDQVVQEISRFRPW